MKTWRPADVWRGISVLLAIAGSVLLVNSSPPLTAPLLAGFEGMPQLAPDNLLNPDARAGSGSYAYWAAETDRQDLHHPDMGNPRMLNRIIWFSVRGSSSPMPEPARLPAFQAMQIGIREEVARASTRPEGVIARRR